MEKIIAIISCGLFFICSCTKVETPMFKTENGVIIEKPYLWWNMEEEHDQEIRAVGLFYNESFLAESKQNGKSSLALINYKNGTISWRWSNYLNSNDLNIDYPYMWKHYLYILSGSPRSYCIDLNSGKEIWKKDWGKAIFYKSNGFESELYVLQDFADGIDKHTGFYIQSIETGNLLNKIIPLNLNDTNRNVLNELGSVRFVNRINKDGKIYYLVSYQEAINDKSSNPLIGLFNYTDNIWIYEHKNLSTKEFSYTGNCIIAGNKIYHSLGKLIICHDLWTADSLWSREFKGGFLFGEYIIDNGTLYAAAEGDGYYALDAETGAIKWKGERAPGTSSRMVILNGVLYYINGADGHLWALDASNGKTLWKLRSPDNDFGFKREINVMPGDGKRKGYVLTSTWHGACAYEAER